jgi:thiol-disulfide isomerase/thioredoxin
MKKSSPARSRLALVGLTLGLLAALALALAVLGPGRRISYTVPGLPGSDTAKPIELAARPGRPPAQPLEFTAADGRRLSLDEFRGRVVLVNLWATWCPPCIAEMPALDALEARLGGGDFQVVAVSLDRGGEAAVRQWFARTGIGHLAIFNADPAHLPNALLPTSLLLDREGKVAWQGLGARAWDKSDAVSEVEKLIAEGR